MTHLRILTLTVCVFFGKSFAQTNKKQIKKDPKIGTETETKKNSPKQQIIKGKVTQSWSYCGGAAPSEEMLEEASRPKPYSGKVFYVRKGKSNSLKEPVILSFTVSASGTFSFHLPAGEYSIIQEPQLKALNLKEYHVDAKLQADEDCLKKWWLTPYYILEVKDKEISNLNFEFHHPCFVTGDIPCIQYYGPMPP